jgi:hypothetical protein
MPVFLEDVFFLVADFLVDLFGMVLGLPRVGFEEFLFVVTSA